MILSVDMYDHHLRVKVSESFFLPHKRWHRASLKVSVLHRVPFRRPEMSHKLVGHFVHERTRKLCDLIVRPYSIPRCERTVYYKIFRTIKPVCSLFATSNHHTLDNVTGRLRGDRDHTCLYVSDRSRALGRIDTNNDSFCPFEIPNKVSDLEFQNE
jgi:hypothetical protein